MGVGGLQRGCGALAAGKRRGGSGGDRYKGRNRRGEGGSSVTGEEVHVTSRETKQRGGEGEVRRRRTGSGGEREVRGRERERTGRSRRRSEKGELNYGLQDVKRGLARSQVHRAKGVGGGTMRHRECRTEDGERKARAGKKKRNKDVSQTARERESKR